MSPVRIKQYPLKLEARTGLVPIVQKFLKYKLLIECESKYNTPILPVKKANGKDYRLVQDLRAINQRVQDIHPVVANPHTLLTTLTSEQSFLLLSGKILKQGERHNTLGQFYHKVSRIAQLFLEISW